MERQQLNERERNIVDLINNLSEVAENETTTKEAIDRILSSIRQKTAENIQKEMEDANKPIEIPNAVFPDGEVAKGMKYAISDERMKMMQDLTDELRKEHGHVENTPPLAQMVFTRVREVRKPEKAHRTDAGIDFFVPDAKAWTDEYKSMIRKYSRNPADQDLIFIGVNGVEVAPGAHVAIPSGIKTIIPQGLAMMMVNKSGVATKLKLDHSACLIDSEYRDELIFCFFNHNIEPVKIEPGMKITQGLIVPVIDLDIQEVLNCVYDEMGSTSDRGGGFGSSGN